MILDEVPPLETHSQIRGSISRISRRSKRIEDGPRERRFQLSAISFATSHRCYCRSSGFLRTNRHSSNSQLGPASGRDNVNAQPPAKSGFSLCRTRKTKPFTQQLHVMAAGRANNVSTTQSPDRLELRWHLDWQGIWAWYLFHRFLPGVAATLSSWLQPTSTTTGNLSPIPRCILLDWIIS